MSDLIEALTIFLKYGDKRYPTICVHDALLVVVDPNVVSVEDKGALSKLGFSAHDRCFISHRFGSC